MALLVNHYIDRNFKVVEINNSVALRSGAIIAQTPLKKAGLWASAEFIENGYFFNLDVNGELKAPGNVASVALKLSQAPILHFTEELMTGPLTDLKYFAEIWEKDGVTAYPRGLVLTVGDTFTTNNFIGNYADGVAVLTPAGQLVTDASIPANVPIAEYPNGYSGPLFRVIKSTLPDGETNALEVTYLGNISITAA